MRLPLLESFRVCSLGLVLLTLGAPALAADVRRPNILLVVADDLGWHDVGYHGSEIRTPHLDRLARGGVRLERHYVYPTCSPTRAGLFTSRNPARFGIHGPIGGRSKDALPRDVPNLATTLSAAGYDTALVGKWHLGLRPEVGPRKFGFAASYGYLHGQIDQLTHHYKNGDRSWHRNDNFLDEKGHATDLLADEAVRFVRKERDRPFFLWLAFSVPHHPLQEDERWVKPYLGKIANPSRRLFAASVTHMDAGLGRVVEALEKSGKLANTLIVFTSDNGGQQNYASKSDYGGRHGPNDVLGDNRPWRGWKGGLYEGGIRVPALAYWQGQLRPAERTQTVSYLDWMPTLTRLAGGKIPERVEGRDVWPLLAGQKKEVEGTRLWWDTGREQAMLEGDRKLIVAKRGGKAELYDLADDRTESKDLAREKPEEVKRLLEMLRKQVKPAS